MRRFLLHRQADKLDGRTHMQFLPRLIPLPRMVGCSTFDPPERCKRSSSRIRLKDWEERLLNITGLNSHPKPFKRIHLTKALKDAYFKQRR